MRTVYLNLMEFMIKKIFMIFVVFQIAIYSQTDYLMTLANPIQNNTKTLEFDIKIKGSDTIFLLSSYQCSLTFNLNLLESDSISLEYLHDSSELGNPPINIIGYDTTDGMNKLVFVSGIGSDSIANEEKIVGKFKITSTVDFTVDDLNLKWNFNGIANTILTGSDFNDITVPSNHLNFDNSITSINDSETIPNQFNLNQNYPNPFNPTTKIEFTVPAKGNVKLIVYNMLGEKVAELINGDVAAGNHTVQFNGRNFASGAYVYILNFADQYSEAKKMILMK